MARRDPHSHADDAQPRPRHLRLRLAVDFDARALRGDGDARPRRAPAEGTLDLDTKALAVDSVVSDTGARGAVRARRRGPDPRPPPAPRRCRRARARSRSATRRRPTRPRCSGSRPRRPRAGATRSCSASARRSTPAALVPLPGHAARRASPTRPRSTVPAPLAAVMSAGPAGATRRAARPARAPSCSRCRSRSRRTCWRSPSAISSRATSRPRSRVWAEPATVDAAACEFAGIEAMIAHGRGAVRPLRLGPLRHAGAAAVVPVRRHGEPAHDVPHADAARRRPLAGGRGRARAGALLDRQPRHERQHGALLAERGLHGLGRAAHPRGAARRGRGGARAGRSARRRSSESLERFGAGSPLHPAAHRARGHRPRRRLLLDPVREGRALPGARSSATAGRERFDRVRARLHRALPLHLDHHRGVPRLPGREAARASRRRSDARAWLYEPGMPANAPVFRSGDARRAHRPGRRASPRGARPTAAARSPRWSPSETARLPPAPAARARPRRAARGSTSTSASPAAATTRSWSSG